jgi:hypothetical protein
VPYRSITGKEINFFFFEIFQFFSNFQGCFTFIEKLPKNSVRSTRRRKESRNDLEEMSRWTRLFFKVFAFLRQKT